jgi:hypothetical protein
MSGDKHIHVRGARAPDVVHVILRAAARIIARPFVSRPYDPGVHIHRSGVLALARLGHLVDVPGIVPAHEDLVRLKIRAPARRLAKAFQGRPRVGKRSGSGLSLTEGSKVVKRFLDSDQKVWYTIFPDVQVHVYADWRFTCGARFPCTAFAATASGPRFSYVVVTLQPRPSHPKRMKKGCRFEQCRQRRFRT